MAVSSQFVEFERCHDHFDDVSCCLLGGVTPLDLERERAVGWQQQTVDGVASTRSAVQWRGDTGTGARDGGVTKQCEGVTVDTMMCQMNVVIGTHAHLLQ